MAQTANLGLPLIDANMTADVPRDMNALAEAVDTAVTEAVAGVTVPDATTTQKGVVQLNDTTTSTSKTQAGTADAVRRAYDRGNEGVTAAAAAQAKADAAETPAGAQAKANAAETNAKNASVQKVWANLPTGDLNTLTAPGRYQGIWSTLQPNEPITTAGTRRVELDVRSNAMSSSTNIVQYLSYIGGVGSGNVYWRIYDNNVWGAWKQITDPQGFEGLKSSVANGKQAIATAISGKGVAASGSDEFAVLADKISQIKTGIQVATGNTATSSGVRTIANLPFKPQILVVYGRADTLNNSGYQARSQGYGIAYNVNGTNKIGDSLPAFLYKDGFEIERDIETLTNVVFGANSVSFDGITGTVAGSGTAYIVFGV